MVELAGTYDDPEVVMDLEASKIVLRNLLNYCYLAVDKDGKLYKTHNHPRNIGVTPEFALAHAVKNLTK